MNKRIATLFILYFFTLTLYAKYNIKLNSNEKTYLEKNRIITMCVDPNWMPFEKITPNGRYTGIIAEYINIFSKRLNTNFHLIKTDTYNQSRENLSKGTCDIITADAATDNVKKQYLTTKPYFISPRAFVVHKNHRFVSDFKDISNKKIGVLLNSPAQTILPEIYPNINIFPFDSTDEGLLKVSSKEIDAFVSILGALSYSIQQQNITNVKIGGATVSAIKLSILINKDKPQLVNILNKAIDTLEPEDRRIIQNKWIPINYENKLDYRLVWQVAIVLLIILGVILYKNRTIKKMNNKLESLNMEMSNFIEIIDNNILTSSTDLDGNITSVSKAFCDSSGYTKEELVGQRHNIIRHEDMSGKKFKKLWDTITTGKTWQGEIKNKAKNGDIYWVDSTISPIYDQNKQIIQYMAIWHDITNKKKIEEISVTDQLTQLYNRFKLEKVFDAEIPRVKRYKRPLSLILLDIDYFKSVNDNFGHNVGDEILKDVANILKNSVRKIDVIVRWGGEEFIIIALETSLSDSLKLAEKIRKKIENFEFKVIGKKTATFGVSTFMQNDTRESLIKRADEALYEAKNSGRNKVLTLD